jgi:hypothetical protein
MPDPLNDAPRLSQNHFVLNNFAKKEMFVLCADGNEIRASSSVIATSQADGSPVVNFRVEGRGNNSFPS